MEMESGVSAREYWFQFRSDRVHHVITEFGLASQIRNADRCHASPSQTRTDVTLRARAQALPRQAYFSASGSRANSISTT
jgi:hypothetical protein